MEIAADVGALHLEATLYLRMSVSLELSGHGRADDVGKILAKVQDDIQYLRATAARAGEGELDLQALDMAINRTEKGINAVAEHVMHASHSHVTTLPAVIQRGRRRTQSDGRTMQELVSTTARRNPIKQARTLTKPSTPLPTAGLSPGQQAQVVHMSRLLSQPSHPITRQVLTQQYQLPAPPPPGPRDARTLSGLIATGTTIDPLTTLPRANRRDAQLTPPPISQGDARRGLLSLLERGLIPPAAEIVLSPPPVQPKTMQLHTPSEQFQRQRVAEKGTELTGVKLDPVEDHPRERTISIPLADRSQSSVHSKEHGTGPRVKFLEPPGVAQRPRTPPSTLVSSQEQPTTSYKIVVQGGSVVDTTNEFRNFKKDFHQIWDNVLAVLHRIEELCRNYAIPVVLVDSHGLSELASEYELGIKPTRQDLLECLINAQDVAQMLRMLGRRYKGAGGIHAAATKIQATFRMYVKRQQYLEHRRKKWATGVITMSWLMFLKMYRVREQLKTTRGRHLESHQRRARELRRRWSEIKQSKRVIVHLPSQGYPQPVRASLEDFHIKQSLQMARICDVRDPNVEVLYISAVPVEDEVREYYGKLLAMGPGGEGAIERVHFVTPERVDTFSRHRMALSSVLMYSPRTMQRIRHLITGRETYIMPGVVSQDDLAVADKLGLPVLGPEPEISQLYATKSGAKRIFADAQVSVPPSEGDIFSEEQLLERLASLIANHLLVTRWLFKLPDHVQGNGFAYCDVTPHLQCHSWVLRESQRYGQKWTKRWAQESALKRILLELPGILSQYARPVNTGLFPAWSDFMQQFLSQGGLIEGCPPSDSVTPLTVDVFIEPTGTVNILSAQDQICSSPYHVWGVSIPQTSVSPAQLQQVAERVGAACRSRGIIGHFSIDFITFIHPETLAQELWGVDLDLGYSDHLALHQLLSYVTGAQMDWESGTLQVPGEEGGEERFAVLSPHLHHTNLSVIHYQVFFQMCKAHHIGYDTKERVGTLFTLVDGQSREHLGMICLQDELMKAISSCSSNLATIHQEISTPHMQGHSNFQAACEELNSIMKLTLANQQDNDT